MSTPIDPADGIAQNLINFDRQMKMEGDVPVNDVICRTAMAQSFALMALVHVVRDLTGTMGRIEAMIKREMDR